MHKFTWGGKPLRIGSWRWLSPHRWRHHLRERGVFSRRLFWGEEPAVDAAQRAIMNMPSLLWRRRQAVAMTTLLLLVLLLPGEAVAGIEQWLKVWLGDTAPNQPPGSDKWVHFALFMLWAWTLRRAWPTSALVYHLGCLLFAAVLTELGQWFVPGRGPDPLDALADIGGGLIGLLLGQLSSGVAVFTFGAPAQQTDNAQDTT